MILPIRNFKRYILRKVLPGLLIAIAGLVFLNYFLAWRLENYLKREISNRVLEASGGFYQLTYDDLSIHLKSGELMLEGVHISPVEEVFNQWQRKDSLPQTYLRADIGRIDFKGINLIWRWDYRQLDFSSFEIIQPDVEVVDAFYSDRHAVKQPVNRNKTLYEYIEPYIKVLTVNDIDVVDASVAFLVEHPLTPIRYAMKNVSFYGDDFRLDSLSYENGKLLYCESFVFHTLHPQVLLKNNDFSLATDSILISTKDSILYFENVRMIPDTAFLHISNSRRQSYLNGEIGVVKVDGVDFSRYQGRNYLKADSLQLLSSDITVYDLSGSSPSRKPSKKEIPPEEPDSILSLSLYTYVSPLFKQVGINYIGIQSADFQYNLRVNDSIEQYTLVDFDFKAREFLIDSVYEARNGFWYARDFAFTADHIEGLLTSRNYRFEANRIGMSTVAGKLYMDDINLTPLRVNSRKTYIDGQIDSLRINGLKYDNGITAAHLWLYEPTIRYNNPGNKKKGQKKDSADEPHFFSPFLRYLDVDDIRISKGNLTYQARTNNELQQFRVQDLDFYATDFYMDEETWENSSDMPFLCDDYGFHTKSFDNKLFGNSYRLTIGDIRFTNRDGLLRLQNIGLIPDEEEAGSSFVRFTSPEIAITGLRDYIQDVDEIVLDSIRIERPDLEIIKRSASQAAELDKEVQEVTPFNPFQYLAINDLWLNHTKLKYDDRLSGENFDVAYDFLHMNAVEWNTSGERDFTIGLLEIQSPVVAWTAGKTDSMIPSDSSQTKTLPELFHPYAEQLRLHRMAVNDIDLRLVQPYMETTVLTEGFRLDSLNWILRDDEKEMHAAAIDILTPDLHIYKKYVAEQELPKVNDTVRTTIYEQLERLAEVFDLKRVSVEGANLSFENEITEGISKSQNINQTDLIVEGLLVDNKAGRFHYDDLEFRTENLSVPISNGFYDLNMEYMELVDGVFFLKDFHMVSPFSKWDYAYLHPKHADWFDVRVDSIRIEGVDLLTVLSDTLIRFDRVTVDHPLMLNFKNKKIYVPPRYMPMFYEAIQKAPVKIDIPEIQINNFEVVYEELSKKGSEPGRLHFNELNGHITGFTNIVSHPEQYIHLDADGKFYDNGHFNAVWMIPVDSLNDRFILNANMPSMDLLLLNEMIAPLASAELAGGHLDGVTFTMDAGSIGGSIDLLLLYNDLRVNIYKMEDGNKKDKKFLNLLVNAVLRDNNPNRPGGDPRYGHADIIRDPYHSSFNYLWQLLRPPLTESVGITQQQQNIAGSIVKALNRVKSWFGKGKKKENVSEEEKNTD